MDTRIVIDVLIELAGCEHELTEILGGAARAADRDRGRRELADEYADDADAAAGESAQAEAGYRAHARELKAAEARLADRRARLVGITDRRQHKALTREIAELERTIERLELEALALLDEADEHRRTAGEARLQATDLGDRSQAEASRLAAQQERAAAAREEIDARIERLVGMLPPDIAGHVARLRRRDGHATAWLADGVCSGCFVQLPPQATIAADAGRQLVKCPSCARYVVRRPWR